MVNQTLDESSDKSDHNIDLDSLRLLIDINNNFKKLDINIKKDFLITKIQSCWRGYLIRKFFRKNKDKMKLDLVIELLKNYNNTQILYNNINKSISKKKIRNDNFPSHVSENIAKFAIYKKYKIMPNWDTESGDLEINLINFNKKLEIKAFSSNGPTSFGPTEAWDIIYFVDAKNYKNLLFKIYEIKLKNTSQIFQNIKVNKNETFKDQADKKRRPRISFNKIKEQIHSKYINLIFNGHINDLF
jgi:hypothetical protein